MIFLHVHFISISVEKITSKDEKNTWPKKLTGITHSQQLETVLAGFFGRCFRTNPKIFMRAEKSH